MDMEKPITQIEAGRIITHFRGIGIVIKYRELTGFTPIDAAKTDAAKKYKITAQQLAEAAGRK